MAGTELRHLAIARLRSAKTEYTYCIQATLFGGSADIETFKRSVVVGKFHRASM